VGRVVCEGSWIVVGSGGAGRLVPSSVRRVQVNASARPRETVFRGLWTVVVGCQVRGPLSPRCLQWSGCWTKPRSSFGAWLQ
jgi:hypothetical protein